MEEIDTRLERGGRLIEQAGGDPELLGVALLAFQGALDRRLRELIATNPSLTDADRAALDLPGIGVAELVEHARQYGDLTREQAWRILEVDRLRADFAAGGPFRGSPSEVRAYGRLVAELCGRSEYVARLANIPTAKLALPVEPEDAEPDTPPPGFYDLVMRWLPGLVFAALLLLGAWALFARVAGVAEPAGAPTTVAMIGEPTATFAPIIVTDVTPTALPTPTLASRRARIIRLGGGPGWLHESPSFDSPTLPVRLSEGQEVALLDQQAVDPQGNPWVFVGVSGYTGWSPLNNIEEIR